MFGCVAHVKRVGPRINKLLDRSIPMVFIGYEIGTKGYRLYDSVSKKLHVSRDVMFEENWAREWIDQARGDPVASVFEVEQFTIAGQRIVSAEHDGVAEIEEIVEPVTPNHGSPPHLQWSTNIGSEQGAVSMTPPGNLAAPGIEFATLPTEDAVDSDGAALRFRTVQNINDTTEEVQGFEYSGLCLYAAEEPRGVDEALSEQCWRDAMQAELGSIKSNGTWELSALPPGHCAIGLKWVFKVKNDPQGNIIKHKARLVAKGYAQRQGVDFEEVFAPVARIETVRLLIAIAAQRGWKVHHMDVKSTFLNGELREEVYVQQPPGFVVQGSNGRVLKLKRALYGLWQAPRAWYAMLDSELTKLGFIRNSLEHVVYKRSN
jgi:hypothetical protein